MKNILLIGGTFNELGGKPSGLIKKIENCLDGNVTCFNGGTYESLRNIIESTPNYDYVFWFANVEDNSLAKIRNVKDYAPKCMLITSKRNDNSKYDFEELLQRALATKSNLCFEFSKLEDKVFNIRIFDPLGCVWYDGTSIEDAVKSCLDRLSFLSSVTRKPSINKEDSLNIVFDENDKKFLEFVKESANTFHKLMCLPEKVDRFVGNASLRFKTPTRCMNGFPAMRKEDYILISRRNVDKTGISEKDFVPCYLDENDNTIFLGENKPSVDTPVQLRLFRELKNIDYILHGHCYINGAPITKKAIPCGAIEEVEEILKCVNKDDDFVVLNLRGHGCLILSSAERLDEMKNVEFIVRPLPELI